MLSLSHILLAVSSIAAVAVKADYTVSFPSPRGELNEDNLAEYCGGYEEVSSTRTEFPISDGFINLGVHHVHDAWTVRYLLSNNESPESFDDFTQIGTVAEGPGMEGEYCLTLNLEGTNATDLEDGANRTLQVVWDGGHGPAYTCADITLSTSVDLSSISCANVTEPHEHEEGEDHDHDEEEGDAESSTNGGTNTLSTMTGVISFLLAGSVAMIML